MSTDPVRLRLLDPQAEVEPCEDTYTCECSHCRRLVADRARHVIPGHGLKSGGIPMKHKHAA